MTNSRNKTFKICFIGLMAAIVFVVNYLRIPFMGTQLHMTNALCVLCGLLFGPGAGFLAAGIGSGLYDIVAGWGAECIITFINKFLMAFVAGWLHQLLTRKENLSQASLIVRRVIAAAAGCVTYVVLYMTKSYITLYLQSNIGEAVDRSAAIWATVLGKGYTSLVNGLIAVVVANLIYSTIAGALKKQHLSL